MANTKASKKKTGKKAEKKIKGSGAKPSAGTIKPIQEPKSDPPGKVDDAWLPKKDLFRLDEVAEYFTCSVSCIRTWIDHGHFEVEKLHGSKRITRRSILNFRLLSQVRKPTI